MGWLREEVGAVEVHVFMLMCLWMFVWMCGCMEWCMVCSFVWCALLCGVMG